MMWLKRLLNRWGFRKDTIVCIRQENTWQWPDSLGKMTEGKCEECNAAIFYEEQNEPFRKICHRCAGM